MSNNLNRSPYHIVSVRRKNPMKKELRIGSLLVIGLLMTTTIATAAVQRTMNDDQTSRVDDRGWPPALWNFVKNRYHAMMARADFWYERSGNPFSSAFYPLISHHAYALYMRADLWVMFWDSVAQRNGWGWPSPLLSLGEFPVETEVF